MGKERILFVCGKNVGRSQMGEGFLRAMVGGNPRVEVESAGVEDIEVMRRKYGDRPNPQVIEVMREEGIDISGQRIKELNEGRLRGATEVVVFVGENELPEYARKFKGKMSFEPVDDPAKGTQKSIPVLEMDKLRRSRDQVKGVVERRFGKYRRGDVE